MPLHFLSLFSPDAVPDCYAIRPKKIEILEQWIRASDGAEKKDKIALPYY